MRTFATLAGAALTLAGCSTGTMAVEGSPPVRQVVIARLPEQPAHGDDRPLAVPPGPVDRSDPAAVAVALIVSGLAQEGLEVVDIGVQTLRASPDEVCVRVAVAHRAELAGAAHTSVYEIDLRRDLSGSWRPAGYRQAQ